MIVHLGCGNFGGIGSAPEYFGHGIAHDEAFAIMDRAWAEGIGWFDTADAYGGGASESWIGEWRRARGNEPQLTTKVFHSTSGTPGDTGLAADRIRRQLAGSLARLGVERVDVYLAHEPDPATPLADTVATFEALRTEGLIGAWGLSNFGAAEIAETRPLTSRTPSRCSTAPTRPTCSRSAAEKESRTSRSGRSPAAGSRASTGAASRSPRAPA